MKLRLAKKIVKESLLLGRVGNLPTRYTKLQQIKAWRKLAIQRIAYNPNGNNNSTHRL